MALSTTQYGYIIDPMVPFTDDKGKTIKNGFVRVFVAGSSTPVVTYRNFDGATNQDRIELDNSGRTKTSVIGSKGLTYKVCVYDKHHSQESPILTVDKVSVIGANITAGTGATVVTGLDGLTTKPDGFVDASVIGTDGYVALDHTLVTDDLNTDAKVTAVENDRYIPLLNDDVNDPDSKMTLGRLWQWVLGKIKSLSTTITAFRTGDVIPVDGPSGTAKMSKDDLLRVTTENALIDNLAPAFDPDHGGPNNDGNYPAGYSVIYQGKLYTFRVNHLAGPWNANEVAEYNMSSIIKSVDANNDFIWHRGGLNNTNGEVYREFNNRLYSDLLPIIDRYTFAYTPASGVTFLFYLYAYGENGAYLGQLPTPSIPNIRVYFPAAKFYRICLVNIVGVSLDTSSSISAVCTFSRPIACYSYYDFALANHVNGRLSSEDRCFVDLNDPLLWDCVGISGATGGYDFSLSNKLTSKLIAFTDDTSFVYTAKNSATFRIFVYTYTADGKFLRRTETNNIISARSASDGKNLYRISVTNISIDFNDITDVVEFKQWSVDRNVGTFRPAQDDYSQNKFFNTCKLKQAADIPYIAFCFDDVWDNDNEVVAVFRKKMLCCGFAFIASTYNLETKTAYYSRLQKEGFDILNHSNSGTIITSANYPTYQEAFDAVYGAFDGLRKNGFVVNGFVAPSSQMESSYKSIVGKLHAFGFIEVSDVGSRNTRSTPVDNLHRFSIESRTINELKAEVDRAISNDELLVFYGHASRIGVSWSLADLSTLLDYCKSKEAQGLCRIDNVTNAVRFFYGLH